VKDDFQAIAAMLTAIGIIVLITFVFVCASQWLMGVAYRIGLVSWAAQWTVYMLGLGLCIGAALTITGRLVNGAWWFSE
jgi:hypothetical protein